MRNILKESVDRLKSSRKADDDEELREATGDGRELSEAEPDASNDSDHRGEERREGINSVSEIMRP